MTKKKLERATTKTEKTTGRDEITLDMIKYIEPSVRVHKLYILNIQTNTN